MDAPVFHAFDAAHLTAIAATLVLGFGGAAIERMTRSRGFDIAVRSIVAVVLALNFTGFAAHGCLTGAVTWKQSLPFQLCDWATISVIVALARGAGPRLFEVLYFWGIGGSLQAIITPNLPFGFPDYRFLVFFIDHCGIVIGVLYLLITRRFRPTLSSFWRTWLWSLAYFAITLCVDQITGVNYGFLLHKPEAFSILSYLSDYRPIYLFQLNLLALMFFAILYVPFAIYDATRPKTHAA